MNRCPSCGAPLGPDEDPAGCVSCSQGTARVDDLLIAVLETSRIPLPAWDIARMAGQTVTDSRVLNLLRADMRACWAGRGRYGLVRHGLAPRIRDLGSAAGLFVHIADDSLSTAQVDYVLRRCGYRFSPSSLYPALGRAAYDGLIDAHFGWRGVRGSTHQRSAAIAVTGLRGAALDAVLDLLKLRLETWLAQWERRVAA